MALVQQKAMEAPCSQTWRQVAYNDLAERLTAPSIFPCTFSQNAFRRKLLLFSFVENLSEHSFRKTCEDLTEYIDISSSWDGRIHSAHPLIMLFSPAIGRGGSIYDYHAIGWRILQYWHDHDPKPWPHDVSKDPHSPFWSMCYSGTQLFVNMSNPAHTVRKSRNLGSGLALIVNPRERFDIVAGDNPEGRKMREHIRNRISAYDGMEHCHQLGSFQAGETEWWQYGIIEENVERTDRCPFAHKDHARSK